MSAATDNGLSGGAAFWLRNTGDPGSYSGIAGVVEMNITVERDIESLDDRGLMLQRDIAFIPSGLVDVRVGDTLSVGGNTWEVIANATNEGHLQGVHVRRVV